MNLPLIVLLVVFVTCFLIKLPIALGMMVSSIFYCLLNPSPAATLDVVANQFLNQVYVKYVMIAIPLFIFAAKVMNSGGVTDLIFKWANTLVGRWKGGLGHVNILASLIFSGMTGAATADAAGLGLMEIEAMRRSGYDDGFSCAITAGSATIGPIFPPSIPMILYATMSGVSVGALFLGGIIPGVLLAVFLMAYVAWIARKRNYPKEIVKYTLLSWLMLTFKALPALFTPVILLIGIYTGIFTPTEAGAIAGIWAISVSFLIYKTLGWNKLWCIFIDTVKTTGICSLLLGAAFSFSYIISFEKIPQLLSAFLLQVSTTKYLLLIFVNILFLILGMFIDTMVMIVVFVPIVLPLAETLGIDLVHFGVVIVLNMMIGLSTPPFGGLLFITSGVSGVSINVIIKEIIPIIFVLILVLVLITFIPQLVLFIPQLVLLTVPS